jgi:O-antigen ligase
MTTALLISAFVPYALGLLLQFPKIQRSIRHTTGPLLWLCVLWVVLFAGQAQVFKHEYATSFASLSKASYYQLAWMAIGATILLTLLLRTQISSTAWRLPIVALFVYVLLALAGAAFSAAPFLSIYNAAQLALDGILLLIALSVLTEKGQHKTLLELSYFLLGFLVAMAALGGILKPAEAFQDVYGSMRGVMHGALIKMHANELGLMSAIIVIVALRRAVSSTHFSERLYWGAQIWLGLIVLFNATARTSIGALVVALLAMTFLIRRLRPFAVLLLLVTGIGLAHVWVNRVSVDIEGTTAAEYLRRGSSDENLRTLSGRIPLWGIGWEMAKDAPLLGHGFEAGVRYSGTEYGLPYGTNMHSGHMEVLVNSGFAGYAAWLCFLLPVAWRLFLRMRRRHFDNEDDWGFHVEAVLVAFVILFRSLMGAVLVTHQINLLVYAALLLYVYLLPSQERKQLDAAAAEPSPARTVPGDTRILRRARR